MPLTMKLMNALVFLYLLVSSNAWLLTPYKVAKSICRKNFLVGTAAAAAGIAIVGSATAAGAATVVANQQRRNQPTIYEPQPSSMTDQVVLITGGSTGLGLESAKRLAAAGATIVLTSRTLNKGEQAVQSVQDYLKGKGVESSGKIFNLVLDLDDLDSVRAFPESFAQLGLSKIDVLLNNAGVMAIPDRQLTKDGYERTFQSNHLGHFLLTAELFPYLNRDKAVVINVSSEAYLAASKTTGGLGLDLENLNGEKRYAPWSSYGLSKLSNILFTQELQRRADATGENWLTAVALHPGVVQTDLGRYVIGEEKWNKIKTSGTTGLESLLLNTVSSFLKTVPEGASTQVFLASGAEGALKKGAFYEDLKEKKNLPAYATDKAAARALWEKSEELAAVKFDLTRRTTSPEAGAFETDRES